MAKKGKNKKTKAPIKSGSNPVLWIIGAIAIVIVLLFVTGNIPFNGSGEKKGKSFTVQGGETRPVLDPSMFRGTIRSAYAAAKKYPEVLDQVYCYCYCDAPPFEHKSLLSCFVDKHGAG
jgi:hypothetical protein